MRLLTQGIIVLLLVASTACGGGGATKLKELQRVHSGAVDVVLLSDGDALKQGKGTFVLEFRDSGGALVDVGAVGITASMAMPGMAPMFGDMAVMPADTKGRYNVVSDLNMAGTWRLSVTWNGSRGQGSASMSATAS